MVLFTLLFLAQSKDGDEEAEENGLQAQGNQGDSRNGNSKGMGVVHRAKVKRAPGPNPVDQQRQTGKESGETENGSRL